MLLTKQSVRGRILDRYTVDQAFNNPAVVSWLEFILSQLDLNESA